MPHTTRHGLQRRGSEMGRALNGAAGAAATAAAGKAALAMLQAYTSPQPKLEGRRAAHTQNVTTARRVHVCVRSRAVGAARGGARHRRRSPLPRPRGARHAAPAIVAIVVCLCGEDPLPPPPASRVPAITAALHDAARASALLAWHSALSTTRRPSPQPSSCGLPSGSVGGGGAKPTYEARRICCVCAGARRVQHAAATRVGSQRCNESIHFRRKWHHSAEWCHFRRPFPEMPTDT
jgi:hypothetical protein